MNRAWLSGLRSAIAFDGNGAQRRLVSEKLDFSVAFVPFGDKRARCDSDSADVVVAKKIGFTEVVISAATESGNSLPSQHRYPIVDRLKAGFAGSVHEVGQAKRSAAIDSRARGLCTTFIDQDSIDEAENASQPARAMQIAYLPAGSGAFIL